MSLSILKRKGAVNVPESVGAVKSGATEQEILLFATRTCPNCKMAERFLSDAGIAYKKVIADEEPAMVEFYDIHQAPTLVVPNGGGFEKIVNVSNIRKFTETAVKQAE